MYFGWLQFVALWEDFTLARLCVSISQFDPNLLKLRKDEMSLPSRQRAVSSLGTGYF